MTQYANVYGLDPGKSGGMAKWCNGKIVKVCAMPIAGKTLDLPAIASWLSYKNEGTVAAYIEKVGAMPLQGVTSMFTFGFVTGCLHGILSALKIPFYVCTPQSWKKVILAGTPHDKAAAVEFCMRTYPYLNLRATARSTKPHDGICDAVAICSYGVSLMR
jgi:crossover junction endodeoxyribonuclease RuvC